jgi:uncharacterized protein (TIGR00303 family)
MRDDSAFLLVAGTTETALIDGISAAGAAPDLMVHTPSADAEIVTYGEPITAPIVPVSPSGCPTPAVTTRAVGEVLDFRATIVDAGLARATSAPTIDVEGAPGRDVREATAVPTAQEQFEAARELGSNYPASDLWLGETIPGGTTTALGVLTALGEPATVSSSLPENPIDLKREVVADGLDASGIAAGDLAGNPLAAVAQMGDPVLATVSGLTVGALEAGTDVTLAGGTQMLAAAALVRHAGHDDDLSLATTSFVANDESARVDELATSLDLDVTVTDPGFDEASHPALDAYERGEAKEGVGMGGALALADRAECSMATVREQIVTVAERLTGDATPQMPDGGQR